MGGGKREGRNGKGRRKEEIIENTVEVKRLYVAWAIHLCGMTRARRDNEGVRAILFEK